MEQIESVAVERNSNTYKIWSKTRPQHMAAYRAALFGVCAGALDGWTATAIPYLQQPDNFTVTGVTYREASWILSLCHLGSLVGAMPAGYLANRLGRRRLILIMAVLMSVSWFIILSGHNSIPLLYIVRFIQGFICGVASVAYYLYCEEIAEDRVRGAVSIYLDLIISVGMVYVYFCGAIFSYIDMTTACTLLPLFFAAAFYSMPESPLYLLTKGQADKAKESLRWLRGVGTGQSAEIEGELNEMESFINKPSERKSFSTYFRSVSENSKTDKDMKIVFGLMIFRQLCGMNTALAYTVHVFQTVGSTLDPYLCTAVFGLAQFLSNIIANFMVRLDRKIIFPTFSGAGMVVCLLAIVLHSLLNQETDKRYLEWLPLIAVKLYIVSFSVGLGPVPWFMRADRLCKEDRVWIISIAVCLNSALAFFVTKFFPIMMNDFGSDVTYGILAVICLVGTIIVSRWFNGERERTNTRKYMKLEEL